MFDPTVYLNQAHAKSICCGCDDSDKQKLSVTPPLLYYSYIPVGESSEAQPLIITNVGSEDVAVQSVTVTDDFWIENKSVLPINLLPGKSVTLQIKFKPKDPGVRHCTVQIKAGVKPAQDCVVAIGIGGKHEFVADIVQMKKEIEEQNLTVQLLNNIYQSDLRWAYDISLAAYDLFGLGMIIGPIPVNRECYLPSDTSESKAGGSIPTLFTHVFAIEQNDSEIGTLSIDVATGSVTWDIPTDTTFEIGDLVQLRTIEEGFDVGANYGVTLRFRRIEE